MFRDPSASIERLHDEAESRRQLARVYNSQAEGLELQAKGLEQLANAMYDASPRFYRERARVAWANFRWVRKHARGDF